MQSLRGLAAVALLYLLSRLPWWVLHTLGSWLGRGFYLLHNRNRSNTEANLQHCFPHWSAAERDQLTRRSLMQSGMTAMEMAAMWIWPCAKTEALIREVHGLRLLDCARAKQRGVILLTPHLGNWEMVGFFAARIGTVTSLYAPAKLPALDRLIYSGRIRNGSRLVPTNASGVRALFKALKAGEMVIVLPDQVPEEGSGVFAPFFSQPALTMTLLGSLAQRTGAEVLCCYARRRADGRGFDIDLLPAHEQIAAAEERVAATAVNLSVQGCVTVCPEQYQWGYKRFRERPAGGKNIYRP